MQWQKTMRASKSTVVTLRGIVVVVVDCSSLSLVAKYLQLNIKTRNVDPNKYYFWITKGLCVSVGYCAPFSSHLL